MTEYASGIANRIGPYHYADGAIRRRTVDGVGYIVGIAGAYNAFGLIGSECNGIFVLDVTNKKVVLDRDTPEASGYSGPSKAQWARLEEITKEFSDGDFLAFISKHERSRLCS